MTMQTRQRAASWLTKDTTSRRPETCATIEHRDEILNIWENKHSNNKNISINGGNETSSETRKK
jgi:hypothetical protein